MTESSATYKASWAKPPRHVAIIMDGNGRWARARGMERSAGHVQGVNTVRTITEAASQAGIEYLTLYAFSTENWNRPQQEVDMLMHLIVTAIERETPDLIKNNVRLTVIGDRSRMPENTIERLDECCRKTAQGFGLNLVLAISYSAKWELTDAMRKIATQVQNGNLQPHNITTHTIQENLSTNKMPDVDILIRTGGEHRVSNFLLWQIAYAEIFVTQTFWPEFTTEEFNNIINEFAHRERRFGLTGDQISSLSPSSHTHN